MSVDADTYAASRGLEFAGPQSVVTWLGEIEMDIRVNGQAAQRVEIIREYGKRYRIEVTVNPPQRHWAQGDS